MTISSALFDALQLFAPNASRSEVLDLFKAAEEGVVAKGFVPWTTYWLLRHDGVMLDREPRRHVALRARAERQSPWQQEEANTCEGAAGRHEMRS